MGKMHVLGALVLVGAIAAPTQADTLKIFILAGQSNANGAADPASLPFAQQAPLESVPYWYFTQTGANTIGHVRSESWEQLRPGVRGGTFGPEITLGHTLHNYLDDVAVLKIARNGSTLYEDWDPDATDGRLLYSKLVEQVNLAVAAASDLGYDNAVVEAMMWVQGEDDAARDFRANVYETNLTAFLAAARRDLPGGADMRVVVNQLSTNQNLRYLAPVRAAQAAVAQADPLTELVDSTPFSLTAGRIHYDDQGYMDMGVALAESYLIAEGFTVPEPGVATILIVLACGCASRFRGREGGRN